MRLRPIVLALVAVLTMVVSVCRPQPAPALASNAAPAHWYLCTLHLDYRTMTRVVARTCHTYGITRSHPRRVGWTVTRARTSPHVVKSVRYPVWFRPPPALPSCYWPAVRRFSSEIYAASGKTGIPAGWIAAVIETESSGDPSTVSQGGDGADIGLMQFGPAEAAMVGGAYTYEPAGNIMTGSLILAYLRGHYAGGNLQLAVAMYNGGAGNPQWGYEAVVAGRLCQ